MAFGREDYLGIPASSALAMALMESSGIRKMIDDACEYDGQRLLRLDLDSLLGIL